MVVGVFFEQKILLGMKMIYHVPYLRLRETQILWLVELPIPA